VTWRAVDIEALAPARQQRGGHRRPVGGLWIPEHLVAGHRALGRDLLDPAVGEQLRASVGLVLRLPDHSLIAPGQQDQQGEQPQASPHDGTRTIDRG
jgi:hypothetical protein